MSRSRAALALAALAGVLMWALLSSSTPAPRRLPPAGAGDAALFLKVVDRLAAGEPYYDALGEEMRRDNYPAKSPFNWRTPFHLTVVAGISVPVATLILKLVALAAVLATAAVLTPVGRTAAITGTLAQMGAVATAFSPDAVGVSDVWAGVLIALSACAYYRAWWVAGALLGATAVFLRELAAPYCVVCAVLAFSAKRRETIIWIVAGLGYAVYYGLHVWQVSAHQLPGDLAHVDAWQQWNGLRFTLATIGVNGWLSLLPRPFTAVFMVLGLAGAVERRVVPQVTWALLAYVALFAVVGLPFNYYWGFVTAPVWAFGVAHAPQGLRQLVTAASGSPLRNGDAAEVRSRS